MWKEQWGNCSSQFPFLFPLDQLREVRSRRLGRIYVPSLTAVYLRGEGTMVPFILTIFVACMPGLEGAPMRRVASSLLSHKRFAQVDFASHKPFNDWKCRDRAFYSIWFIAFQFTIAVGLRRTEGFAVACSALGTSIPHSFTPVFSSQMYGNVGI